MDTVNELCLFLSRNTNKQIILLRDKQVLLWIFGITDFLNDITIPMKEREFLWGKSKLKLKRPDLNIKKQWTNKFGEHLCEEILLLLNKNINKPSKKNKMQLDIETEDWIIEVKTGTYFTTGTALEKILGTPFKYAEIPKIFNKPLKIICIGGAEKKCIDVYKNIISKNQTTSKEKQKLVNCFKELDIEFLAASELLRLYI